MNIDLRVRSPWSLLVTGVLGAVLADSPVFAATFSSSIGRFRFSDFSHVPQNISTFSDTDVVSVVQRGNVETEADADAVFSLDPSPAAVNFSSSRVSGFGRQYLGSSYSISKIEGYDFRVRKHETFSFDFSSALNLGAFSSRPQQEKASAGGSVFFQLFDTTHRNRWNLLDTFSISGLLTTGSGDFLEYTEDDNITFKPNGFSILSDFGDDNNNEVGRASIKGIYSRKFDRRTKLTLVEVTENWANANSDSGTLNSDLAVARRDCDNPTPVPEPSTMLAASVAIAVSLGCTSKRKQLK